MERLRIGICQMSVQEGGKAYNVRKLEQVAEAFARQNNPPDLLCFPELCISGYDWEMLSEKKECEKHIVSQIAGRYAIPILAGVLVQDNGQLYDAVCIWGADGTELSEYRKIHLWGEEENYFAKGNRLCLVDFKGWKLAVMICADLGFAPLSTEAALQGADVIIYPSAWSDGYHYVETLLLTAKTRAIENQIYTIALNRASGSASYCGNSLVCGPDGTILLHFDHDLEACQEVMLEKNRIQETRKLLPWLQMRRPDIYQDISKH